MNFRRDNDSLYVMPLQIVPFATPALRRGKLIRNTILKPAIEVYRSEDGVSGQILIEDITPEFGHYHFGWDDKEKNPDYKVLRKLAKLTSYDIYTLRIFFRELDITLESVDYLELSNEQKQQLNGYMRAFTQPLVKHIYGETKVDALEAADIIRLFSDPDTEKALQNIRRLADLLDVEVEGIPAFLEDFADIYLSFSYYQQYLDDIVPKMSDMVKEIDELRHNWQMKQDANLMNASQVLVNDLNDLTSSTTGRFESFHKNTENMWNDLSAERFRSTETMIRAYHKTIGGVLCGLGIKMNAWKKRFPNHDTGSPQARVEMILSSMMPGMEIIKRIDAAAPHLTDTPVKQPKPKTIREAETMDVELPAQAIGRA
ncbi:MAG: hypothetical protein HOM58_20560 [Rhodospirillaceae bacterium]|nr:hypothetical protein [Rhodospirillaceae bacterium]